ncbi:hypothetical protein [Corallococcus sicarius]|uniref:Uncharacterized protein n=1 Tax=Corallococcus sicarius TaxID=2316726 RepID=A0A3A8NSB9_9BACT|nr:hypothetical protein [Corallococcus sicarius]RKH46399.1 hypothetical protein D7X12_05610 [Corallococcus sicarius]
MPIRRRSSSSPPPSRTPKLPPAKTLPDSVKLTDNKQYGVHDGLKKPDATQRASLFVNTSVPASADKQKYITQQSDLSPTRYSRNDDTFERHQFKKGIPDCMHNGEEIMHGRRLPVPTETTYTLASKEKVTQKVMGESDEKNIAHSQEAKRLDPNGVEVRASPAVGEAYDIIRQGSTPKGKSPYHSAPVVARDGQQTVTVEQSAGSTDGTKRNTFPTVDLYRVGHPTESFQGRYGTREGYGKDAITVVAQPHGPESRQVPDGE